jgi:hypothetical protein
MVFFRIACVLVALISSSWSWAGSDTLDLRLPRLAAEDVASRAATNEFLISQHTRHPASEADARRTWLRTTAITAGSALAIGLYGMNNWWQDGFTGRFRTIDEGWFGENTYSGGADKLGHVFMNYVSTRLMARAFEWAGNESDRALQLGAWFTLGTFAAVEVVDGYSKQWRFSREDAVMNVVGTGIALLLEKYPALDDALDLRLLYWPSRDGTRDYDPVGDYSGQTYLAVLKASGVPGLRTYPLLRYVEFAAGYGTRGYSATLPGVAGRRARNLYIGISLNLSELLGQTVFKHSSTQNPVRRATDTLLEFIQVPGTAGLARYRLSAD